MVGEPKPEAAEAEAPPLLPCSSAFVAARATAEILRPWPGEGCFSFAEAEIMPAVSAALTRLAREATVGCRKDRKPSIMGSTPPSPRGLSAGRLCREMPAAACASSAAAKLFVASALAAVASKAELRDRRF